MTFFVEGTDSALSHLEARACLTETALEDRRFFLPCCIAELLPAQGSLIHQPPFALREYQYAV